MMHYVQFHQPGWHAANKADHFIFDSLARAKEFAQSIQRLFPDADVQLWEG